MAAAMNPVVADEIGVGALGPSARGLIDLPGKTETAAGKAILVLTSDASLVLQCSETSSSISSRDSANSGSPPIKVQSVNLS